MRTATTTFVVAAVATLASAGNVYVDNRCGNSVWLQSFANQNAAAFKTELFAGSAPGYVEIERPATMPAGNNSIVISGTSDMSKPLIFSYSLNSDVNTLFYSFVSDQFDTFEPLGYEVLTNGGHDAVTCAPQANPNVCASARNTASAAGPVFTVPLDSQPGGPSFTLRVCASDGAP